MSNGSPSEDVKKLETADRLGGYLRNCRMRTFNLIVMSPSNLSILHGLCTFGRKLKKGIRSTFFPTSPRPVFASWIFSQLLRGYVKCQISLDKFDLICFIYV